MSKMEGNPQEEKQGSKFKRLLSKVEEEEGNLPQDLPQNNREEGSPHSVLNDDITTQITKPDNSSTQPSTQSDDTPPSSGAAYDTADVPLPNRVNELDINATRVTPSAYGRNATQNQHVQKGDYQTLNSAAIPSIPVSIDWRKGTGCVIRLSIIGIFIFVVLLIIAGSFFLYQYNSIASTLPNVNELQQRAAQFETTRILDRNGNVLYEIVDPTAGRRSYVPLEKISPYLIAATVATEDKEFLFSF